MWKKYKTTLILTTLISLFPTVIGLLLWNRMPDTIWQRITGIIH